MKIFRCLFVQPRPRRRLFGGLEPLSRLSSPTYGLQRIVAAFTAHQLASLPFVAPRIEMVHGFRDSFHLAEKTKSRFLGERKAGENSEQVDVAQCVRAILVHPLGRSSAVGPSIAYMLGRNCNFA